MAELDYSQGFVYFTASVYVAGQYFHLSMAWVEMLPQVGVL
jgi:hypothetical protein